MRRERTLTAAVIALLLAGFGAVQTGVLPLAPIAGAVLQVGGNLAVPPLTDPAMIRRGAVHYDLVCATCHASPAALLRGDALRLTPPAPKLHRRRDDWLPEVAFLTVKHGVRNTAMPAWPARDRDDEVWAMVAFLLVLPDLAPPEYRALAGLNISAPPGQQTCVRCHDGAAPRLDLQTPDYLADSLRAFRNGTRQSGFMHAAAAPLSDTSLTTLARVLGQGPQEQPPAPPEAAICAACHGPTTLARPAFPRLQGLTAAYLETQLRLFTAEDFTRGGGPYVDLMREAVRDLTEDQISTAAHWYAPTDGKVSPTR